ncbi:ABC transporter ATP-binding protein [Luteimonas sp. BDR2-5]|uniref:ABC transporter ATP-binding protein n=1 Tax=Proluteimonas luteida TaxID=2878685 RepID=UPI001E5E9376|nr:ABC transporter ATP-binding protein [Luteimonas sp. BDR2-5]MCD9028571.1 ABC transporter ATP-binding protein [Luteimonas sp. BDR2-5]
MLALRDIRIGYGRRVLATLPDLDVQAGEFVCLLGRNGQGKSTLLRTLGGFLSPLAGEVSLDGVAVRSLSGSERARRIAVVLTERVQAGALGVRELVELGRQPHTGWSGVLGDEDRRIAADALERVEGAHLADRSIDSLSDGERQRVMIARALAQQPQVLLLDEITAFLDLPSRVTIIDLLRRIAREQGVAIVLSSHDLELSLETADRLWLLPGEGHFLDGTPEDIALSGAIGATFDQHNLRFSLESGRFESTAREGRAVQVAVDGVEATWLCRALRRSGFTPLEHAETGAPVIRFLGSDAGWQVGDASPARSIAALLDQLRS